MHIHNGARTGNENSPRSRLSQQEIGERIRPTTSIGDLASGIAARRSESILAHITDEIGAHLEIVVSDYPGQGVAECCKVLAGLTFGVAVTVPAERNKIAL